MNEAKQTTKKRNDSSFIKRNKKLFIILIVIAAAAVVFFLVFSNNMRNNMENLMQAPQTIKLEKMDLEQIVSGTGTLQSRITREVTSSLSYDIIEIYVDEGDYVMMGQLLARLDTSQLDDDIAELRRNISNAEAQDSLSLTQAERKVQDAINQYSIDEAKLNNEINNASANLSNAKTARDIALADMNNKQQFLNQANNAVTNYPPSSDPSFDQTVYDNLVLAAAAAQTNYDNSVITYGDQQNLVNQAQTAYDAAVQQKDTTLRQSSINFQNARDAVDTQKLRDSAANYRSQLRTNLDNREKCEIAAPISGTITVINAVIGNSAGGGGAMGGAGISASSALFTIEDTNQLEITSSVPEYDAVIVRVGMKARITTDAFTGKYWEGIIKSISTKATDDSGNFTMVIEVTSPVEELAIGMNAKINIITEYENNVFAVPYDAVTTDEMGRSVVYSYTPDIMIPNETDSILHRGTTSMPTRGVTGSGTLQTGTPIVVQTGMETDYYIEISGDGLKEGMLILADPEGKNADSGSGGGFPFGGGF